MLLKHNKNSLICCACAGLLGNVTYLGGTILLAASRTSAGSTLWPNSFSRCSSRTPCKHHMGCSRPNRTSPEPPFTPQQGALHYLVSCSDDKHPPQNEALAVHVALVTRPPGPYEVLPDSQSNEAQTPHLPPQRAVKVFLQTEATVSRTRTGAVEGGRRCPCRPVHR